MTPIEGCTAVLAYCAATRGSVSSWGRTSQHNDAVGGHPQSFHLDWLAWDVVYDEPLPVETRKRAARHHGLRLVVESDHDHLQPEVSP